MANIVIEVKPKTIRSLITQELKTGRYWLPSFQRQFVWDSDDIKELVDSIFHNYPIGAIILWKPSGANAQTIDPVAVPLVNAEKHLGQDYFYIIDGQQRLTSLLLLFNNWEIKRGNETITSAAISYNSANQNFIKGERRGINISKIVQAFCLDNLEVLKEVEAQMTQESLREVQRLALRILDYEIPVYVMQTITEDEKTFTEMAEAFIRVNKNGIKIGNLELMLSFMAGTIRGELKGLISDLSKQLFERFEIDNAPVFRFVFSNFGLKQSQITKVEQFKANVEHLKKFAEAEQVSIFQDSEHALILTLDFIDRELGIHTSKLLPSQNTLIPIAAYFHTRNLASLDELNSEDVQNIINWFVLVNFHSYYSSSPDTKLNRDLELIYDKGKFPYQELLETMKERHSKTEISYNDLRKGLDHSALKFPGRVFLFFLYAMLARRGVDDWSGQKISSRKYTDLEKHHIFPKEYLNAYQQLEEIEDPDQIEVYRSNFANITFIDADINSEIGDAAPESYLRPFLDSGRAQKHFIPADTNLLRAEQYEEFIGFRMKEIYNSAREVFVSIVVDQEPSEIPFPHPKGKTVSASRPSGRKGQKFINLPQDTVLICKRREIEAHAKPTGGKKILVLQGSFASKKTTPSFTKHRYRPLREKLINDGILQDAGDKYVFSKDYEFAAPSAGAAIVLGRSANGKRRWKTNTGVPLSEFMEGK